MTRVLIVEDEQHIAEGLRFNLEAEGCRVEVVDTGEAALDMLLPGERQQFFDAMVLDVMLPGKDGFSVISELRQAGQFVPTLILTARGRPEDVLAGFEAGADDYLAKPFDLGILIARLHGLLLRREWLSSSINGGGATAAPPESTYTFNGRTVDFDRLELTAGDQIFRLTLMEANLLRFLVKHEGKPVSRKTMLDEVWGLREDTDTRAIDNFIVRLRRYIEDSPSRPHHLRTVRGVGYCFVSSPPEPLVKSITRPRLRRRIGSD
ncbi:MAG TPA: response regulator transcription factor [Bryobacteraceae bacterium]|nr:response regulator transcription factor [Bryobacteraceae bacterium]